MPVWLDDGCERVSGESVSSQGWYRASRASAHERTARCLGLGDLVREVCPSSVICFEVRVHCGDDCVAV